MPNPLARRVCIFVLLAIGLGLWWFARALDTNVAMPIVVAAAVGALLFFLFLRRSFRTPSTAVDHPSPTHRAVTAAAVTLASIALLYATALLRGRDLFPVFHDEFSYLLQTRMLAQGRLWMPPHPLADFFQSFFVIVRPVYSSLYFPGTALLNVPGIWFSLPEWFIPLLISGASAGMLYLIVCEWCGTTAGLLAALLLISLPTFRGTSVMVMSHPAMLLLGESMIFSWLRWRASRSPWWIAILGMFSGWAAITRPVDAIAYAVPIGVAVLVDLLHRSRKEKVLVPLCIVAGALPFLSLQILLNIKVTGRPFYTPYQMYLDREQPQSQFSISGHSLNSATRPETSLQERDQYYDDFLMPEIRRYREQGPFHTLLSRLNLVARSTLPHPVLAVFLPLGCLAAARKRRWVLLVVAPVAILLYTFNPILLEWYTVPWTAPIIFGIVLGIEQCSQLASNPATIQIPLSAFTATLALFSFFAPPKGTLENLRSPVLEQLRAFDITAGRPRAVVLFSFPPGTNFHVDPVYNIATANPDDAYVIRARDLGAERDVELIRYYAQTQPDRELITINLGSAEIKNWGKVGDALLAWPVRSTTRSLGE